MSKIICDVCGTSYPETATHCPICGCVRAGDAKVVAGNTSEQETQNNNYTYVKGGRFSKSNVKKRSTQPTRGEGTVQDQKTREKGKGKDTGIVVAIIILLLAIVAVVVFIAMRFFAPASPESGANTTQSTTTIPSSETSESTVLEISCQSVSVSKAEIVFEKAEAALLLNVSTDPIDTTDLVVFASTDELVATVTQDGKVSAVGPGQAVITITCGQAAAECRVVCNFEAEPSVDETEPSSEATEPETAEVWDMNWSLYSEINGEKMGDVSLTIGEKWAVYLDREGKVKSTQIKFATSDASVIVVDNTGVATAIGPGNAVISAEYNGTKVKCYVRVN